MNDRVRAVESERSEFWTRTGRGWDIAFYVMSVIGVATLAADSPSQEATIATTAVIAVLVLGYTLLGRRAVRSGDRRAATAYLVLLVVAVTIIVGLNPSGMVLLFIAYSQIWYFAETRRAGIVWCTVLTGALVAVTLTAHDVWKDSLGTVLGQAALTLSFAVLLGLWVTYVAEKSEERAYLLAQLEEAQAEAATSHHAAGVLAERERMAREIHDTLAQGFTSVVMLAQTASADLDRSDVEAARARLTLVESTARENLAEARALVAASAPVGLEGSTLVEAVGRLARRFGQETGIVVEVAVDDGLPAVGRDREVVLLRAAQEALSNVRRHAGAQHVQLTLGAADGAAVHLEIIDDGRGMAPGVAEGFGLRGMRERVTSGGGELAVTSGVDVGTRVQVTVPAGDAVGDSGTEPAVEVTR